MSSLQSLKKGIPIDDVAHRLGLKINGGRVSCFNKSGHKNGDKHPSLFLMKGHNSWKCFGCGKWGSVIDLVSGYRRLDFKDAADWLREEFEDFEEASRGVFSALANPTKTRKPAPVVDPMAAFLNFCGELSGPGLDYLQERRGLDKEILSAYGITSFNASISIRSVIDDISSSDVLSPFAVLSGEPFVVIPYFLENTLVCLQARRLGSGDPKYVNTGGEIPSPWNIDELEGLPDETAVFITEGVIDALSLICSNEIAIAVPSARTFKQEWVFRLARFVNIVATDSDPVGKAGGDLIEAYLLRQGADVRRASLPEGFGDLNELLVSG